MRALCAVAIAAVLLPCIACAQTAVPDPSSINVPDLSHSADPDIVGNGWKYFFFRREGTSFEEAYDDFADCYRFLQPNDWSTVKLDRFVPWSSASGKEAKYVASPYGLVGAFIGAMIEGTLVRRDYQQKMRRCMEPRGYVRYGVAEEIWENVSALPQEQWTAVQAKIASGPDFGGKVPLK